MARVVFGVATGCYSDYSVEALFEVEGDAAAYAGGLNARRPNRYGGYGDPWAVVEEFGLYGPGEVPEDVVTWHVRIDFPPARPDAVVWSDSLHGPPVMPVRPFVEVGDRSVIGSGPDRERLVKAAREAHAMELARREGVA